VVWFFPQDTEAMNARVQRALLPITGAIFGGDGPWRAKSVVFATLVTVAGAGWWTYRAISGEHGQVSPQPFPWYARLGVSYVGGFFIGWALRRFVRTVLATAAVVAMLLGLGKWVGWNSTNAEKTLKNKVTLVEHEANAGRDFLKGLLPSASAAGAGIFLGWRRRGTTATATQPEQVRDFGER
jgi:uncharacterized membrane protein (Fun14 family)